MKSQPDTNLRRVKIRRLLLSGILLLILIAGIGIGKTISARRALVNSITQNGGIAFYSSHDRSWFEAEDNSIPSLLFGELLVDISTDREEGEHKPTRDQLSRIHQLLFDLDGAISMSYFSISGAGIADGLLDSIPDGTSIEMLHIDDPKLSTSGLRNVLRLRIVEKVFIPKEAPIPPGELHAIQAQLAGVELILE